MNQENSGRGEMRAEYDIRGGVRGKYLHRYTTGTNAVTAWFTASGVTVNRTDAVITGSVAVGSVELGSTPRQRADAA